ncbi:MAG: hypothetical protein HOK41_02645 [Nitrospina sp.]|jgi:hypothetical protein|nr:hypothetical protein [Nitrospina sp.]MBT6718328.1 hypothetical protein [Nitrospina sp.]
MTLNIGQRDKMFLIGGGVFVACYLLFFLVAEPIYKKQENINGKIKDKINFIEKYYEVLNQTSYYQAKEAANKNIKNNLHKRFLNEKEPGLAAAGLQKLLQGFSIGAVTIEKTRVEKPKFIAGILAVPVEITVRSNLKNLALFLMRIENHQKFLIVEEFRSRRINKKEPEDLQTRLLISGFTKELDPKGEKPI